MAPTDAPTASAAPTTVTKTPTAAPTTAAPTTAAPTSAPTAVPTTAAPTAVVTTVAPTVAVTTLAPTDPVVCEDTILNFKFIHPKKGSELTRNCDYLEKSTNQRCKYDDIGSACSKTCGNCDVCVDTTLRVKVLIDMNDKEKPRPRSCEWVGRKAKKTRCAYPGVSDACRLTCGTCTV